MCFRWGLDGGCIALWLLTAPASCSGSVLLIAATRVWCSQLRSVAGGLSMCFRWGGGAWRLLCFL
jgi:hypothetical protein